MSETEHNKGKLTRIYQGDDLEGGAEIVLEMAGIAKSKYHESFLDALIDEGYRKYFVHKDSIYQVDYKMVNPDSDVFNAQRFPDGSINFETRFYNGGCSFNEALEYALESD